MDQPNINKGQFIPRPGAHIDMYGNGSINLILFCARARAKYELALKCMKKFEIYQLKI